MYVKGVAYMYRVLALVCMGFCLGTACSTIVASDRVLSVFWMLVVIQVLLLLTLHQIRHMSILQIGRFKSLVLWTWSNRVRVAERGMRVVLTISLASCVGFYEARSAAIRDDAASSRLVLRSQIEQGAIRCIGIVDGYISPTAHGFSMPFHIVAVQGADGMSPQSSIAVDVWLNISIGNKAGSIHTASVFEQTFYTDVSTIRPGDMVSIYLRFRTVPAGPFATSLLRRGITVLATGSMYGMSWISGMNDLFNPYIWQGWVLFFLHQQLRTAYGSGPAGLILGFTLGDRTGISKTILQQFVAIGIIHAFVASGATVRMSIRPVLTALHKTLRKSSRLPHLVGLLLVTVLVVCTGMAPPAVRAASAYAYELIAEGLGRKPDHVTANAVAAVILALMQPHLLFDPGVILSYTAVLTLMVIPPLIRFTLLKKVKWTSVQKLLSRGLAAELGMTPLIATEFGQFAIFSLVVNIFLYPLLEWVMPVCFVLLLFAAISPEQATILRTALTAAYMWIHHVATVISAYRILLKFKAPSYLALLLYDFGLLLGILFLRRYSFRFNRK